MEYRNILLIKMSSLGDVLHTLPFVAALRRRFPDAKITWVVHPQFADLIPGPPYVDRVIRFRRLSGNPAAFLKNFAECRALRRLLHAERFDLVVDLQGLFKSGLVALLSGCKNRIGPARMREGSSLISRPIPSRIEPNGEGNPQDELRHAVERNLDVARFLGASARTPEYPFPDLAAEENAVRQKLADAQVSPEAPYAVLVPETRWVTKRWPLEHFALLAERLTAEGLNVVLTGGPGDRASGAKILQNFHRLREKSDAVPRGRLIDLTGETTLRELAALIRSARIFISGDTGPLHIAAALQTPLVAVYGPTRPGRTGPYGAGKRKVLVTPLPCGGCLKKRCGDFRCMEQITPEAVLTACRELRANTESD